ncbi:MAG: hypothetical protein HQM08_12845 [Candidatus Riflebacteria bacterium]|nr:hypothetical protein [Candidatus Riflebacteria bacterium]
MRINQNVLSIQTESTLSQTQDRLSKSIQKLSSGLRINSASDDAAGLAISEKLRRQINGLNKATLNAQDGISMLQTAEGSLNESTSILQRMRELAVQGANDTLTSTDRSEIQKEVNQLRDDLNRISQNTEFNTKKLLDGSQTALFSASSSKVKGIITGDAGVMGGDYNVSIALIQGGMSQMQKSQTFTLKDGSGTLAKGATSLKDITQFYDSNGVFTLSDPQTLTLQGGGKTTSFQIDANTTLDQLVNAFGTAIGGTNGLDIGNSQAMVIGTANTSISGDGGYFELVSGKNGADGEISVLGNQNVLDAMGISTVRESAENVYNVALKDGKGNSISKNVDTNRVSGLLGGVDIKFNSQAGQISGTKGVETGVYVSAAAAASFKIRIGEGGIVTVSFDFGNGAGGVGNGSGYWTMAGLANYFNQSLVVSASQAVSPDYAQMIQGLRADVVNDEIKFSYTPTGSQATNGSTLVVSVSDAFNVLGLTEGVFAGSFETNKREDKTALVISKVHTALFNTVTGSPTSVAINISDGTNNTDVAITAIADVYDSSGATMNVVSDGVLFSSFQASVNSQLSKGSVAVRLDEANGAMTFTSLRVGRDNTNTANLSYVKIDNANDIEGSVLRQFGFGVYSGAATAVQGSGDTNFKIHLVSVDPQFQIGADEGQKMNVAIGDMSSEALGVDNLNLTTIKGANAALAKINQAIDKVSSERSKLGAYENRLTSAIDNLKNTSSNLTAAESRIRDVDIAQEMIEFTRNQIVSQAGTAMLAQANTVPQSVMQLLK